MYCVAANTGSNEILLKYHNMGKARCIIQVTNLLNLAYFLVVMESMLHSGVIAACVMHVTEIACGERVSLIWFTLSKHLICNHCFLCCLGPNTCSCYCITEWGPTQHFVRFNYGLITLNVQVMQLKLTLTESMMFAKLNTHICIKQSEIEFAKFVRAIRPQNGCLGRVCLISWDHLRKTVELHQVIGFNSAIYPSDSGHKTHKFASAREGALDYTLKALEEDGVCLVKSIMDKYKE